VHVTAETAQSAGVGLLPDLVLPGQFGGGSMGRSERVAERRLMLAVLEEAVVTFQKYAHAQSYRGRRLFSETAEWFASDDLDWPFAFVNLCHGLDLDVDYLRTGLRRWRERMAETTELTLLPFRRVSGGRHSVTGRPVGLRPLTRAQCRASSSGSGACSG
jgi:hypothetical protein